MRGAPLAATLAVAACFSPSPPSGQPCVDWCPPPEQCIAGFCSGPGVAEDGGGGDGGGVVPVNGNYVFVTSDARAIPAIGGVAGADAWCNELAAAAGLPGIYIAWTAGAYDKLFLANARGWFRTDGEPFADRLNDFAMAGQIFYPPRFTERGADLIAIDEFVVGTGTFEGNPDTTNVDCDGLTATTGPLVAGYLDGGTWEWTAGATLTCADTFRMYCFGTDRNEPAVPAFPSTFRYAYRMQMGQSVPSSIEDFDSLCTGEGLAAGLPVESVRAWLATSENAANERVPDGPDWVRPDGVVALTGDKQNMLAAINVAANSGYNYGTVWSGAMTPDFRAPSPVETCMDWSSPQPVNATRVGQAGRSRLASAFGGDLTPAVCSNQLYVYCLEE